MFLGRSAFRRMGCFSVVRNFTGWGVSEDGVFQRMQRFSVKIVISQSIYQRMRQMKGCGKSSDRHHFTVDLQIRGSGVSEDTTFLNRLAFHGLQIITGCGKAQDGVISRVAELQRIRRFSVDWHFTVDLQIKGCGKEQDGAIYFLRVAELFCTCSSF